MNLLSRIRTLARIRPLPEVELPEVAGSVAIILDGNGRWAKRRGLPTAAGHRAGARTVRRRRRGGDRRRHPRPVGVRVLDRELVASAGRGRRVDGDLRRDDRARAARSRGAGRARALHRPPRPRARGAAPAHGCDGGSHRAEHAHQPVGRVRLRRPRRARRGDPADRRERCRGRRDRRERLRSESLRAGASRPRSADPNERRAAHLELPALAARLHGARLRRRALARLRRARAARGPRGIRSRRRRFGGR